MKLARDANNAAVIAFVAVFAIGLAFSVNDAAAQAQSAAFTGSWCAQETQRSKPRSATMARFSH